MKRTSTIKIPIVFLTALLMIGKLAIAQGATVFVVPADSEAMPNTLIIEGQIEDGDYERVIAAVKSAEKLPTVALLSSPGGDVLAAMRIGRFLRDSLMTSMVDHGARCNSACVLVLLGGTTRIVLAPLGLHRPFYEHEYFSGLSAPEAAEKYREMDSLVRGYLSEMDVPNSAVERMMATKSSAIEAVSPEEFFNQFGSSTPAFEEWILAKCGSMSESEEFDAYAAEAIGVMDFYEEILRNDSNEYRPDEIRKAMSGIADRAKYGRTLSSGYRDYLLKKKREITACRIDAVKEHQRAVFEGL